MGTQILRKKRFCVIASVKTLTAVKILSLISPIRPIRIPFVQLKGFSLEQPSMEWITFIAFKSYSSHMPTLSLCMIVKDEQEVIERCLSSISPVVDEIIIVDTGSTDNTVECCKRFTSAIYSFEWQHDFAAARNYAFSKASADYILWLDADDIIEQDHLSALGMLKERLAQDVYFLPYNYSQDEYGVSTCTLMRERILKNDGTFQWKYPVHEVIHNTAGRTTAHENIPVKHVRTSRGIEQDNGRNLSILRHAVLREAYAQEPRIWYYLGRELHDHQHFEEAKTAFEQFLSFAGTWQEERVIALFRVAQCCIACMDKNNEYAHTARTFARKAIVLDNRWAEPYYALGEIAFLLEDYEEAIFWFKKCLRDIPDILSPVNKEMYNIRPCVSLIFCYDRLQQYDEAWHYNELALRHKPQDTGLQHNRNYLRSRISSRATIAWYGKTLPLQFPSYRIRAIQMHYTLQQLGLKNDMIDNAADLYSYDTIIFFKSFTREDHDIMQELKASGKQVVLDVSENLLPHTQDFPYYVPMIRLADKLICCSHVLAGLLSSYNPAVDVIEDATEPVSHRSEISTRKRLKAAWIGMPENAGHAERLRQLLDTQDCDLVTIHTGAGHDCYWTLDDWQYHLSSCDFAIAPQNIAVQPAKSNNKATTYMSLGLPVIASPLDAYSRIISHGKNGFIAATTEEWETAIEEMKSPALRAALRRNGLNTAMAYRPANIALKWWKNIQPGSFNQVAVDIIIPTIYDSPHIYLCIESIIACTQIPFNIIVINNGTHQLQLPSSVTVIQAQQLNYAAALNLGIASGSAPYICLMNDDVIVSDGWLLPLLHDVRNGAGFSNPLSNCDYGFLHNYHLQVDDIKLGPASNVLLDGKIVDRDRLQNGITPSAIWIFRPSTMRRHYSREWVPFFCTLTTRNIIEKTGLLDDAFNNGWEDVDLCHRAMQMGFRSIVNENSFVFHFGGTSTMPHISAYPGQKEATQIYFREKYRRPLLCIHAGYAFETWNPDNIRKTGIGGSETAVAAIAYEFTKKGYRVVVCCYCNGKEGVFDEVEYISLENFHHFIDRHFIDVFIISRYAGILRYPVRARKKYFWLHDIVALGSPEEKLLLNKHLDELDGIFCLSGWHRDFAAHFHQLPKEKIIITGNGLDLQRFVQPPLKTSNRFIYSSSPDRSLDVLLHLFPRIRTVLPGATLHIYYGFDNWESSVRQTGNEHQRALIEELRALMQQEGVFYHGRVNQQTLAQAFLESDIWLYPTSFTETFCITALEAQASRTLCICSDLAGLSDTVADRGILLKLSPDDPAFETYLLQLLTDIQQDTIRKNELLDRAQEWAWQQSWESISDQWQRLFDNDQSVAIGVNKHAGIAESAEK
jgi:glycosyltransferase involved in cell wall biosynthesis